MAMVVSHNIPALTTYNTVNRTNNALEKSIQKLSTGLRINSAADDAAGLAISEKMRAQVTGMDRAVANAQDGISMIQTAEGALNETHSILQRMRELTVQAANDTLTSQDRGYIQAEIDQLREEVTRIGNTTQFNKKKLLNGDAAVLWSSSDLSTKAIVNGGLRSIDQFGQKVVTEGNYKIKIKADPGTGEVQKSDIFKIKHENVITNVTVNPDKGVDGVSVSNLPAGNYIVNNLKSTAADTVVTLTGKYGIDSYTTSGSGALAIAGTVASIAKDQTVSITDTNGNELWSYTLTQADIQRGQATGAATGQAEDVYLAINSHKDAIIAKAKELGYELVMGATGSAATTFKTRSAGDSTPGIQVSLRTSSGATPTGVTINNSALKTSMVGGTNATTTATKLSDVFTIGAGSTLDQNASVLFEVKSVDTINNTITLKANASLIDASGLTSTRSMDDIIVGNTTNGLPLDALGLTGVTMKLKDAAAEDALIAFSQGDKFVYTFNANGTAAGSDMTLQLKTTQDAGWPDGWERSPLRQDATEDSGANDRFTSYKFKANDVKGKDIHIRNYYLNEKTGEATLGDIVLETNSNLKKPDEDVTLTSFDAAYVGKVASSDTKLRDLDKFWTSEGVFMLDDPQTITLTQGDGKQASVTLYGTDTLGDVAKKLNDAIATGLGQGQYVDEKGGDKFVTFVNGPTTNSETVKGTFLVRTVIPGESGKVTFSGDENIINAFSLNQLQGATESKYTVSVEDAHTGEVLSDNVKVTGNLLKGVVNPNVDVQFDALSGVSAKWNDATKSFDYSSKETSTVLHLSDNTTVFQIGANEGEDMGIHIGDMRATALGIDRVNVTSRESASRSITILDNAIDKVSTQRARLGAYQNRLEYTVNNLNTASENITAAESRIRDTDMAKEMMNFTKLQIMLQAGTSMLAQANQLPQNVLSLVR